MPFAKVPTAREEAVWVDAGRWVLLFCCILSGAGGELRLPAPSGARGPRGTAVLLSSATTGAGTRLDSQVIFPSLLLPTCSFLSRTSYLDPSLPGLFWLADSSFQPTSVMVFNPKPGGEIKKRQKGDNSFKPIRIRPEGPGNKLRWLPVERPE